MNTIRVNKKSSNKIVEFVQSNSTKNYGVSMSLALAPKQEFSVERPGEFSRDQIDLIKTTIAKGCTDDELRLFIQVAQRSGLDPFMKQIYPVKRSGQMTIQVAIDGYRAIAERTGKYVPGREPSFTYDNQGNVLSSTAYVKKLAVDGTWHEIGATAFFSEYKVSGGAGFWTKMPKLMISKCAEALALRRAFPSELSGMYTPEEMEQCRETVEVSNYLPVEIINAEQSEKIDSLLHPDDRERFLTYASKYCDVSDGTFSRLPANKFCGIIGAISASNSYKLKQEMENVEVAQ